MNIQLEFGILKVTVNGAPSPDEPPWDWDISIGSWKMSWEEFCQRLWQDYQKFPKVVQSCIKTRLSTLKVGSTIGYTGIGFVVPGKEYREVIDDKSWHGDIPGDEIVSFLGLDVNAREIIQFIMFAMMVLGFFIEGYDPLYKDPRRLLVQRITNQ